MSDDPLSSLIGCGNQGGFRFKGTAKAAKLCVLYSNTGDRDWPDQLDEQQGLLTYYGDNKVSTSGASASVYFSASEALRCDHSCSSSPCIAELSDSCASGLRRRIALVTYILSLHPSTEDIP